MPRHSKPKYSYDDSTGKYYELPKQTHRLVPRVKPTKVQADFIVKAYRKGIPKNCLTTLFRKNPPDIDLLLAGVGWQSADKHLDSFEHAFVQKLGKMQDALSNLVLSSVKDDSLACNDCRLACLFSTEENGMDLDFCEHTTPAQFDMRQEHDVMLGKLKIMREGDDKIVKEKSRDGKKWWVRKLVNYYKDEVREEEIEHIEYHEDNDIE